MAIDLSKFPVENYNDHKYEGQAGEYGNSVNDVSTELNNVYVQLSKVDEMLGIAPENSKDLLTYNVIVSNQEIKDEIESLCNGMEGYVSVMVEKGKEIDIDKATVKQAEAISQEKDRLKVLEDAEKPQEEPKEEV